MKDIERRDGQMDNKQTDGQTNKQTDRKPYRQMDGASDNVNTHTHTHTQMLTDRQRDVCYVAKPEAKGWKLRACARQQKTTKPKM
jgi:hypothetical protein